MDILNYQSSNEKIKKILSRSIDVKEEISESVKNIVADVKKNGDAALFKYTKEFDKFDLNHSNFVVERDYLNKCLEGMDKQFVEIIKEAIHNIRVYHEMQVEKSWVKEFDDNVKLGQKITPLERAGVYVPGGKAFYPSSVLMNIIPAQVAGVKDIVVCTPPAGFYENNSIGATLALLDIDRVHLVGGAQAVAAMAFGTETIAKVDKITGPGNIFVALAKKEVFGFVDIDMIAGPSEIVVLADDSANPEWVALDLLSQIEHGTGLESAVLVTYSQELAVAVSEYIKFCIADYGKKEIISKIIDEYCAIIIAPDMIDCISIVNKIAPEHLEIIAENPDNIVSNIKNAGAIFVGDYSCESVGDYWAGPNHVLPTSGTARFFSPLGVYDFVKRSSLIYYSKDALVKNAQKIYDFAIKENLYFHGRSVLKRFEDISGV